jgi:hypothetical protein
VGKLVEDAADQAGLGDEPDHAHERAAARGPSIRVGLRQLDRREGRLLLVFSGQREPRCWREF